MRIVDYKLPISEEEVELVVIEEPILYIRRMFSSFVKYAGVQFLKNNITKVKKDEN